jgi:hypothetical protein
MKCTQGGGRMNLTSRATMGKENGARMVMAFSCMAARCAEPVHDCAPGVGVLRVEPRVGRATVFPSALPSGAAGMRAGLPFSACIHLLHVNVLNNSYDRMYR